MEYFEEATTIENRGRFGGILSFIITLGVFVLSILSLGNFFAEILISALWRGSGLLALFFIKPLEKTKRQNAPSYISILKDRNFLLYIIPWWMFCLVNYTTIPIINKFFGESFVRFSSVVESIVISAFAIVAGYFVDAFGRKRVTIVGFAMLGLGYAILGIYPSHIFSWYLYIVIDGIAWGTFFVVFLIVLWGDFAKDAPSSKYYAIGGLPFLLSNFIRIIISPYISEIISVYTIFSLASFFLFLAVVPLMFALETLPERKIRERELKSYIKKAKKLRENTLN
jgi:MFS family permease